MVCFTIEIMFGEEFVELFLIDNIWVSGYE
jgi:hypothetical protein